MDWPWLSPEVVRGPIGHRRPARSTTTGCSSPSVHGERAWPDGQRDERSRGAERGAGDAMVTAPRAVLPLDARQAGADGLAPLRPVLAASLREGLGGEE